MYAIIATGGKQYKVSEGDVIYVEKLDAEVGKDVEFDEVLFVDGVAGNPTVKGASVECKVEKHGKNKKIVVFKYNLKRNIVKNKVIDNHILN